MARRFLDFVVAALIASLAAAITLAVAWAGQSITVTPDTGLVSGQTVVVSGRGYSPNEALVVVECLNVPNAGQGDCSTAVAHFTRSDARGEFTTKFTVTAGPFGLQGVNCYRQPCTINVTQVSFNPTEIGSAPISFATPSAAAAAAASKASGPWWLALLPVLAALGAGAAVAGRHPGRASAARTGGAVAVAGAASAVIAVAVASFWDGPHLVAALPYGLMALIPLALGLITLRWRRLPGRIQTVMQALLALFAGAGVYLAVVVLLPAPASEAGGDVWGGIAIALGLALLLECLGLWAATPLRGLRSRTGSGSGGT